MMAPVSQPVGAATIILGFERIPVFKTITLSPNARYVVAERPESMVEAHEAARNGKLPPELVFELVPPRISLC